jgi:hypothetical protein
VPLIFLVRKAKGKEVILRKLAAKRRLKNASARPVGPKRLRNRFAVVKATRDKRNLRRRKKIRYSMKYKF